MKTIIISIVALVGLLVAPANSSLRHKEKTKPYKLTLSTSVLNNKNMPFLSHRGDSSMQNALAMNVRYEPVKALKLQIESKLEKELKTFTGWDPSGEAHVTTITPPEYDNVLKKYVSIEKMEEIAVQNGIQESKIKILALGRGLVNLNGKSEETYFLIVDAPNLLKIRAEIHKEFIKNGGVASEWDPEHFYPHITIGFTLRDLHESDGVVKDVKNSLDSRFKIKMRP